jgi:DNA-binding NarL/FixJ family response regulator
MIEPTQKARILVVEDHSFVRQGMVAFINRQDDLTCCGEADSIAATPAIVARERPDLVLLDLQLKDGEAFELINSLKLQFPELRILVVSQCDETLYAERVLQAGAKGYIMKQEAAQELLGAIRVVLDGRVYLSPAMTARLLNAPFPNLGIDPQKQRNRNG